MAVNANRLEAAVRERRSLRLGDPGDQGRKIRGVFLDMAQGVLDGRSLETRVGSTTRPLVLGIGLAVGGGNQNGL